MSDVLNPQINYKGVFGRHKFPAYQFQEYPKMMANGKDGQGRPKYAVVGSLREELDFRAKQTDTENGPAPTKHPVESERDELAAQLALAQAENRANQERMLFMEKQLAQLMAKMEPEPKAELPPVIITPPALKTAPKAPIVDSPRPE